MSPILITAIALLAVAAVCGLFGLVTLANHVDDQERRLAAARKPDPNRIPTYSRTNHVGEN